MPACRSWTPRRRHSDPDISNTLLVKAADKTTELDLGAKVYLNFKQSIEVRPVDG